MLRTGAYIVVLLGILQNGDTQATNFTTDALRIVECFIENVDKPWQLSDSEQSNITQFELVTRGKCDRKYWRFYECYYPLMDIFRDTKDLIDASSQTEAQFHRTETLEYSENATELQRQANQMLQQLIPEVLQVKTVAASRNETRILTDNCSLVFLDFDTLQYAYEYYTQRYEDLKFRLAIHRFRDFTQWRFLPPFVIVVLTCGTLGNGLLLLIFVRHPETRTGPNAVLINLAISDALFLMVNITFDYSVQLWGFPFGTSMCYVYTFFLTFITGGSVYSMVMLSFSRYVAVSAKPGKRPPRLLTSVPAMIAAVWVLASLVAIPDTLSATLTDQEYKFACSVDSQVKNSVPDFLLISFLPLVVITCFYIPASRKLRESAHNIPGEGIGQDKMKMARERGARILPALTGVFAITYLPFYTFWLVNAVFSLNSHKSLTIHVLYFIVYFLFNLNSTLNPIALYVACSTFRKRFNMYLTCGFRTSIKPPESPIDLTKTTKIP